MSNEQQAPAVAGRLDQPVRCAVPKRAEVDALHSQYPVTTEFDRGYDKARADAAAAIRRGA